MEYLGVMLEAGCTRSHSKSIDAAVLRRRTKTTTAYPTATHLNSKIGQKTNISKVRKARQHQARLPGLSRHNGFSRRSPLEVIALSPYRFHAWMYDAESKIGLRVSFDDSFHWQRVGWSSAIKQSAA